MSNDLKLAADYLARAMAHLNTAIAMQAENKSENVPDVRTVLHQVLDKAQKIGDDRTADFMTSLLLGFKKYGSLTEGQMGALRKSAAKYEVKF